ENGNALGHQGRDDGLPVRLAARDNRRLLALVLVTPLPETRQRDLEVPAFPSEPILVTWGPLAVADAFEDAFLDEPVEPIGEDVAGDFQTLLKLVETPKAEEGVANDQQRPPLADRLE